MSKAKTLAETVSTGGVLATGEVSASQVTGTLPIANGGTGLSTLGTAGQVLTVNSGATALEYVDAGGGVEVYEYDDRGDLRLLTAQQDDQAVVEGLGYFVFAEGSTEPDDDESCFATSTGRWLLEAIHWDVCDTWNLPDDQVRDAFDEDELIRFNNNFNNRFNSTVLFGTAFCSITSVASVASTTFTGTVTGASIGDTVIATPPNQLGSTATNTGRLAFHAYVSSANTVTVVLTNASAAVSTTNIAIQTNWPIRVIKNI